MKCDRAKDSRALLDAAKVCDKYGYTKTAVALTLMSDDIVTLQVDPAEQAGKS